MKKSERRPQNGQTHLKNLVANTARFLNSTRQFWERLSDIFIDNFERISYLILLRYF